MVPSRCTNRNSGATTFFRNSVHVLYVIQIENYSQASDCQNLSGTLLIYMSFLPRTVPDRRVSGPMTELLQSPDRPWQGVSRVRTVSDSLELFYDSEYWQVEERLEVIATVYIINRRHYNAVNANPCSGVLLWSSVIYGGGWDS